MVVIYSNGNYQVGQIKTNRRIPVRRVMPISSSHQSSSTSLRMQDRKYLPDLDDMNVDNNLHEANNTSANRLDLYA